MSAAADIVVIDYHKGNLSSVARGLARAGAGSRACDAPDDIRAAAGLVLPGVGSFFDAITFMRDTGQDAAVLDAVGRGVPLLGICLGMQLLLDCGDEGVPERIDTTDATRDDPRGAGLPPGAVFRSGCRSWVRGLGCLSGTCERLVSARLKVPHVGWNQLHLSGRATCCPLLDGACEGGNVYFTHSHAVNVFSEEEDIAARTFYVRDFPSVVWHGSVFGCQFHPEKSSARGLAILRNFTRIVTASIKKEDAS